MKLIESIILFASLAFLVMFVDQALYKKVPLSDSYFFLMFSLAGFLFYTYRRGLRRIKEKQEEEAKKQEKPKSIEQKLKKK
jgi:TRAP-type C4-dicarboxylate transport system permease small subunit